MILKFDGGLRKHFLTYFRRMLFPVFSNFLNPLSANPTKWPKILKQFVGNLPMNCLNVLDHFVGLALKGLSLKMNRNVDMKWIHWISSYDFSRACDCNIW